MATLREILDARRTPTVLGIDDAPFERRAGAPVGLAGIVCQGTRFEGMLWGQTTCDGTDGTERLIELVGGSKFAPQLHVVLTDGLTVGGLNVLDLHALAHAFERPCVAVMRRRPDLGAVRRALRRLPDADRRYAVLRRAGPIHERGGFVFQVVGTDPDTVARALGVLTDRGRVPEALRLAHLVGAAVIRGESTRRA